MPSIFGVAAGVLVNGVPAPEYGVKLDAGSRKATCYIEAKDGATFSMVFTNFSGCATGTQVWLDGEGAGGVLIRQGQSGVMDGKKIADDFVRPFQFSKIRLTDDDADCCQDEGILKQLGTLTASIKRVHELAPVRFVEDRAPTINKVFHERSKKAQLTHTAGLAAPQQVRPTTHTSVQWLDTAPFCLFEFHYLSCDLLEIKGLLPPLPKPVPVVQAFVHQLPPPIAQLPPENIYAELERLRRENAELRGLKRSAPADMSAQVNKKVKQEDCAPKW